MRRINLENFDEGLYRQNGAIAALAWLDQADNTYSALDAFVQEATDLDIDEDLTADEQIVYAETFDAATDFLMFCGDAKNTEAVLNFMEEECDHRGLKLASAINDSPSFCNKGDEALRDAFIKGEGDTLLVEEAVEKVVRDGKKVVKKIRLKKKKLSSAQRAGLKKARRKAHSGAAKRNRTKSLKKRKSLGI
jgi:hypothetical protein